jgi:hypothetical protein
VVVLVEQQQAQLVELSLVAVKDKILLLEHCLHWAVVLDLHMQMLDNQLKMVVLVVVHLVKIHQMTVTPIKLELVFSLNNQAILELMVSETQAVMDKPMGLGLVAAAVVLVVLV